MTHMCVCIIVLFFFAYSLPTRWKKLLQIFQLKEKKKTITLLGCCVRNVFYLLITCFSNISF